MLDNIDDRFLIISPCGSHAYDLSTDKSDIDYAVMVLPTDFPDVPKDRPIKLNPIIGETDADYFAHRLDSTRDIAYLAGIMYSYPKPPIGGSSEELVSFWTEHHAELLDIAPGITYNSLTRAVSRRITNTDVDGYAISVRNLALLMCRYETGGMIEAVKLNDMWRDRYYAMKNGDAGLEELTEWYKEATADTVKEYFDGLPINLDLFTKWKTLVNRTLYHWPLEPKTESDKFLAVFKYDSYIPDPDDDRMDAAYTAIVLPDDYPNIPEEYTINESEKTYHIHRLDRCNDLVYLASSVCDYSKPPISGNCYSVVNFWKDHHAEMLDIAPSITDKRILDEVKHCIDHRRVNDYAISARSLGLLMCRYETGRMVYAVKLNGLWRDRYYAIKNGDAGVDELMQWYQEVASDEIKAYFEAIPVNMDLFSEWQAIVTSII